MQSVCPSKGVESDDLVHWLPCNSGGGQRDVDLDPISLYIELGRVMSGVQ
jgi:hypothetical protein